MKNKITTIGFAFVMFFLSVNIQAQEHQFYQIKIYGMDNDQQVQTTDQYLRYAYLPALKRMKIGPVGVFKPRPTDTTDIKQIYVLIPFSSLEQFETLETKLAADDVFTKAGKPYINASYDDAPYHRVVSILLKAFEGMPKLKTPDLDTPRIDRIYELRSYESATEAYNRNKVDMFNNGGEIQLFDRLVFNAVFYGEVLSGPKMPNLMYMTTFTDQKSRDAHWEAFFSSPEWSKLKVDPKYQNNVSHADITFLYPTEYSDY
ncbi:NIPSNAP family protein [Flavobacteriaceae bacterium F89]|uniref:NIPSNAP family protein n=1 Tax=Cerina litoralis TaxID=2874477 RepID=A0AAE3JT22_9FLAO|nr:NIPSNAP family protein [Cerina litoralis]MCG2461102.1 NIPSNAP family protein [Cerina litoralis]